MRKVIVCNECDICLAAGKSTESGETVSLALAGEAREIDVCDSHATAMRDAFRPFIDNGRRLSAAAAAGIQRRSRTAISRERSRQIREWADSQHIPVAKHGRISGQIIARYESAHAGG